MQDKECVLHDEINVNRKMRQHLVIKEACVLP